MTHEIAATPEGNLAVAMAQFDASQLAHQTLSTTAMAQNKETLFVAMRAAGISEIIVTFDGAGDSGQVEDIDARRGETVVPIPDTAITLAQVSWGISEISTSSMSLSDAVETLAYDLLSDSHGGWENCDGAFGAFHFDAEAGTILLDYNERFTSSEQFNHSF
ncbi:hypothetical protein CG51_17955 [Haematobacter missouriensis]|uniref:DUF6878 domain-containing protein n=1 Tax=Haematobacter missouriensis TaxID=366616 RepID=A0A212ALL9_9RHOB|nr:DUF6878 family protein [Haematobacter missouriensis]KFI24464.1 hypothetical protein CG51_17955 [Haematobacter missouriensis]OWJ71749.1 hypothetical protein CDV53_18550 [Haematobacter missouriensis]OWJ82377.1 hypothetical protein CDV52_14840 [Haematobacter missouriensis]